MYVGLRVCVCVCVCACVYFNTVIISWRSVESVGGEVMEYAEAIQEADIVLLAVPFEAYRQLEPALFEHKILVDVSNR